MQKEIVIPPEFVVTAVNPAAKRTSPATPALRAPARLLVVALGLGGMADALFYGQQLGIGVPLFAVLTIAAAAGLAWNEGVRVRRAGVLASALPLLFFTAMIALRDNGFLVFLDLCAALYCAGTLAHFFRGGDPFTSGPGGLLGAPWRSLGHATVAGAYPLGQVVRGLTNPSITRRRAFAVVRGLLIAVPVLLVLLPLLVSADAVFGHDAERLASWIFPQNWTERVWRTLWIVTVGWVAAGGFVYALTRTEKEIVAGAPLRRPLGFIEGMTPLAIVGALFAAFVAVQFAYLFGGNDRVLHLPGLTYAEYARRGFAELNVVAVLTLGIVLLWQRLLHRTTTGQEIAFRCLATLLIGLTLVMLASAHVRMAAYEAAYGATETRLYVDVFLVCLGLALLWFVVTLWAAWERRFACGLIACALGYVAAVNVLNPDAFVARTNLARAAAAHLPLDEDTLAGLSEDAVPALCDALQQTTGSERAAIAHLLQTRLRILQDEGTSAGWPSWNASRAGALQRIEAHRAALETSPPHNDATAGGDRA